MDKRKSVRKSVIKKKKDSKESSKLTAKQIEKFKNSIVNSRNRIHVIAESGKWGVLREGAKRLSKIHKDRMKAIAYAKKMASKHYFITYIHREDGSIEETISAQKQ